MNSNLLKPGALTLLAIVVLALPGLVSCDSSRSRPIRNVLLVSIDTCRADYLGCYGQSRGITPSIDAVAAEGVLFENVVSPAPVTLPAHASMLTGLDPLHHGLHDNYAYRLAPSHVTLAEILSQAGYTTGAIVSASVLDSSFGLDQGFDFYHDHLSEPLEGNAVAQRRGSETTRLAIEWLEQNKSHEFFLFLHYFDPHANYEPPEPYRSNLRPDLYAGEIAYADHCIAQVIDKLKEDGLYDSTLVIITSDHGEMLGEHGEETHSYFIYQGALKVPLIFKVPGRTEPRRIKSLVGLVDIVPTVCSLLDIPATHTMQGVDISNYLSGKQKASAGRHIYCESLTPTKYGAGCLTGLVTDRMKYIRSKEPELYDLVADPAESDNLWASRSQQARAMSGELERILEAASRDVASNGQVAPGESMGPPLGSLGYVSQRVDEQLALDPGKDDAKDALEYHLMAMEVERLILFGEYAKAKPMAEEMIRLRPDSVPGHRAMSTISFRLEDYLQALESGKIALRLDPSDAKMWKNMGTTCALLGRIDEAAVDYLEYLERRPGDAAVHTRLGELYIGEGHNDQAVQQLEEALRLDPDLPDAHHDLGNAYRALGDPDRAIEQFEGALALNPNAAGSHYNLANVFASQGKIRRAIDHYRRALEKAPGHVEANHNLGWFLVIDEKAPFYDPAQALSLLRKACELTRQDRPDILGTLAIAQAAVGNYAQAVETTQRALELAQAAGKKKLAGQLQGKLALYKAHRPYHEPLPKSGHGP